MSLKNQKSLSKAVEVTVNNKEENSSDFCLDFFHEFGLGTEGALNSTHRYRKEPLSLNDYLKNA